MRGNRGEAVREPGQSGGEPVLARGVVPVPDLDLRAFGGPAVPSQLTEEDDGIAGTAGEKSVGVVGGGNAAEIPVDTVGGGVLEVSGMRINTGKNIMLVIEDDPEIRLAMLGILSDHAPEHWKVLAPDTLDAILELLRAGEDIRRQIKVVFVDAMYQNPPFVGHQSRHPFEVNRHRGWEVARAVRSSFPNAQIVGPSAVRNGNIDVDVVFNNGGELKPRAGLTSAHAQRLDEQRVWAQQELGGIAQAYIKVSQN